MTDNSNAEFILRKRCLELALALCANCDEEGNCLWTNTPCKTTLMNRKYMIADGALDCDWFMTAVLPSDAELHRTICAMIDAERDMGRNGAESAVVPDAAKLRQCMDCGKLFTPAGNRQMRCAACRIKAKQKSNAAVHRHRYWEKKQ